MGAEELDLSHFMLLAQGHAAFQTLWAATQVGIFDALARKPGISRRDIGIEVGLEERPIRILLTGLTALRLLVKDGDTYRNSSMTERFLVTGSPENIVKVLGWQYHIVYCAAMDFVESLRSNRNIGLRYFPGSEDNLYARLSHDQGLEKIFHDAMASISNATNRLLTEHLDLSQLTHLVDAGGGDGTNAMCLAKAQPHLQVTVFDRASVCDLAKKNISQAGLKDRIDTFPGDFFVDPFPQGIDCILFAHIFTIWSLERDAMLLKRAHSALPKGGKVIIFNTMGWDDETGPMSAALGSVYFMTIATSEGRIHTWKDYEACLQDAGFTSFQRISVGHDHGILIGTKA
jgi:L-tyrosine C(3)-methyltransferase